MNTQLTKSEMIGIQNILTPPLANNSARDDENITSGGVTTLFKIAGLTREINYHYAVLNSNGKITFHAMAPMKHVNSNEVRNPQYRDKVVWASFNKDANPAKNNPSEYQNSNYGNFQLLSMLNIPMNGQMYPNFLNCLELQDFRLKTALVPNNIDNLIKLNDEGKEDKSALAKLHGPLKNLLEEIQLTEEAKDNMTSEDVVKANRLAYDVYVEEVTELVKQGLLTLSTIFINPIADKVSAGFKIDQTMNLKSNPLFNFGVIKNLPKIKLTKIPIANKFTGLIEVTEADISALYSDNVTMLGRRVISTNQETQKETVSLSKVAVIKDYNADVLVLVTINDSFNDRNRSRVETLEGHLDKGNNLLYIEEGYLVPIARHVQSNDSRSGIVFMELRIESYRIHTSASVKKTLEFDAFATLGFEPESVDALLLDQPEISSVSLVSPEEQNQEDEFDQNELQ